MYDDLTLISGRSHPILAQEIAEHLGVIPAKIELGNFPDGEISLRLLQNIRGSDVFLVQSTGPSVNDNLMELLVMIDACKRASAARITAVIPYMGYARQDRKDSGRVPITAKLVANLITKAGADRVLTLDLHAAQIQGFFDVPVDHLYAAPVLDRYIKSLNIPRDEIAIVSPDEGSIKSSLTHLDNLGGTLSIVDKRRSSALETKQANLIGDSLEGKTALIFDDMISTAGSIVGAAKIAREHGAAKVYLGASHAVFCGKAYERLAEADVTEIIVTNSLPVKDDHGLTNLNTISVAPLLGEAIRRIHSNESVSYLFDKK